jgi:hypothetical protein
MNRSATVEFTRLGWCRFLSQISRAPECTVLQRMASSGRSSDVLELSVLLISQTDDARLNNDLRLIRVPHLWTAL